MLLFIPEGTSRFGGAQLFRRQHACLKILVSYAFIKLKIRNPPSTVAPHTFPFKNTKMLKTLKQTVSYKGCPDLQTPKCIFKWHGILTLLVDFGFNT